MKYCCFITLALLALGLSASGALAVGVTYKEGSPDPFLGGTYTGAEDTMILTNTGGSQDQNFGARFDFEVGDASFAPFPSGSFLRHDLVRFDITSLAGQFSTIDGVTLRLFVNFLEGSDTIQAFRLADANAGWVEGTETTAPGGDPPDIGMSTWNQRVQGSENWAGSPGASSAGTDYLTPLIGSAPFDATIVDLVFSDVSFIETWTTGTNAGLFLRTQNESDGSVIRFHSSEAIDDLFHPELIIDFTPVSGPPSIPEPSTWLLFGVGVIGILGFGWRRQKRST